MGAPDRGRHRLPQPVFDDGLPGHQAEPHAIVEQGVTPAGQLDAAAINPAGGLAVGQWAILQARPSLDVMGCDRQFSLPQGWQEVARDLRTGSSTLRQALLDFGLAPARVGQAARRPEELVGYLGPMLVLVAAGVGMALLLLRLSRGQVVR